MESRTYALSLSSARVYGKTPTPVPRWSVVVLEEHASCVIDPIGRDLAQWGCVNFIHHGGLAVSILVAIPFLYDAETVDLQVPLHTSSGGRCRI